MINISKVRLHRRGWPRLLLPAGVIVLLGLLAFAAQWAGQGTVPANAAVAQQASGAGPANPACDFTTTDAIVITDPTQNGRLNNLAFASSCALPRSSPGTFDALARQYKSYTFVNNNSGPTCVTVSLTPACVGGVQLQSAAYLGSFNPQDINANYLGDIGPIPNLLGGSYSFTVPAGATYVVVVSDFLPLTVCTGYTLTVSSNPNCPVPVAATATPNSATQTAVAGSQTAVAGSQTAVAGTQTALASITPGSGGTQTAVAGSQTAIAATQTAIATQTVCAFVANGSITNTDPTQVGDLQSLLSPSTCTGRPAPPILDPLLNRHYDAYTFVNPANSPVCVTVNLTPACLGGAQVQSAAYLNSFDPNNIQTNYLGDIGPIPNALGGSYSFTVPANATYVVVVNEFVPAIGCSFYTLTVSNAGACQSTATPTGTPNSGTQTAVAGTQTVIAGTQTALASITPTNAATQTAIAATQTAQATQTACAFVANGSITNTDPAQAGDLQSLLSPSTCAGRPAPPILDPLASRHYDAYTFVNPANSPVCVTVNLTPACLGGAQVQSAAYLNSFDPSHIQTNYLGDIGPVPNALGGSYSFTVPANATYVVVVNEFVPAIGCSFYTLTVSNAGACQATATATGTPNSGTRTAIAGTQTAIVGTQTAIAGTGTAIGGTQTALASITAQSSATRTAVSVTQTALACRISFSDVQPNDYFYTPVLYLYCHGVISGYADGTFRPYNQTTRSQQVKIVVLGFGKAITTPPAGGYTFTDVPPSFPFFGYIETAAALHIVSGYNCGGPGEPCDAQGRPYFRPYANVTRGQLSKIDVVAAGWALQNPANPTFADVSPGTAFYTFVETAACHLVISGYNCGGPGEPCDPGQRPYFRQYNPATRGQISKIVYLSITGTHTCGAPPR